MRQKSIYFLLVFNQAKFEWTQQTFRPRSQRESNVGVDCMFKLIARKVKSLTFLLYFVLRNCRSFNLSLTCSPKHSLSCFLADDEENMSIIWLLPFPHFLKSFFFRLYISIQGWGWKMDGKKRSRKFAQGKEFLDSSILPA